MVPLDTGSLKHSVSTFETRQRAIGKFVNSKIAPLQYNYTNVTTGSAGARAHLAMLRHGFEDGEVRWLNVGYDIFSDWPHETLGDPADERKFGAQETLNAIGSALQMYALHQQSKSSGMAWFPTGKAKLQNSDKRKHSFGVACRALEGPKVSSEVTTIRRRLQVMEYVPDFEGVRTNLIPLIRMMRSNGITLDYDRLAQDLFRLQFPSRRSSVFKRWGQEYFSTLAQPTEAEEAAE